MSYLKTNHSHLPLSTISSKYTLHYITLHYIFVCIALNCKKEMRQANCVLTMLEKLKTLYTEMLITPLMNSSEFDTDKTDQGKPCMFDLNCPAARCPFRESKKANEFVGHLVNGTYTENEQTHNNLLDNREIVDDADLFVINVGLVDPCRVIAPAKYKDGCSQCFETDFLTK